MSENQNNESQKRSSNDLFLIIEGKRYKWHDQYITGREIKNLGGISPQAKLFLAITNPWTNEPVSDNEHIDLGRPGIEQFFEKKQLKYTIDGKLFDSPKQYVKGAQIRRDGAIQDDFEILLIIKGYEDELIEDTDWVDLARPGIEQFVSRKTKLLIIVNGKEKHWEKKQINFAEIIILAFGTYNETPTMVYTVGYEDGPKQNPEGSMVKGATIFVKNKMIFHATATDKS